MAGRSATCSGRVVRAHGHVYYVDIGAEILECRPRGRFKQEEGQVLAGDLVEVTRLRPGFGVIDWIRPRSNSLPRPPVANVDQVLIVYTGREPDLDFRTLDRFLVLAAHYGLEALLCINKIDLLGLREIREATEPYRHIGYRVFTVSARSQSGIREIFPLLADKLTVFSGQSGVGKSSVLNALHPGFNLKTGELSKKVRRGTHTTRHVELMGLAGGLVADTPGFTFLDLAPVSKNELRDLFREFRAQSSGCRFGDCLHNLEPDCQVKRAVEDGDIYPWRYRHYLEFLKEIESRAPLY